MMTENYPSKNMPLFDSTAPSCNDLVNVCGSSLPCPIESRVVVDVANQNTDVANQDIPDVVSWDSLQGVL